MWAALADLHLTVHNNSIDKNRRIYLYVCVNKYMDHAKFKKYIYSFVKSKANIMMSIVQVGQDNFRKGHGPPLVQLLT